NACARCDAREPRSPENTNAPWFTSTNLSFGGTDVQAGVGVVAYRNYKFPLFMSQPFGAADPQLPPVPSLTEMAETRTRWQLSARMQKTIKRTSSGKTIGLAADAILPLTSETASRGAPDVAVLPSKAIRLGVVLAF